MTDRTARVAAPAALALFAVVGMALSQRSTAVASAAGAAVIAVGLLLGWRRATGWLLGLGLLVAGLGIAVLGHEQSSNLGWFGICVLAGWMALASPLSESLPLGAAMVALVVGQWLNETSEPGWGAWVAGTLFTITACVFARQQRMLVVQLREAQAGLADRARAEERNRIAGEMHDVIGHALTVSLLHVSSARLALDDDPAEAKESLAEAERLAQQSLAEVRAAVGLMRTHDPSAVLPMPGAGDVIELVESFRRAGTTIELTVDGELASLGATRGLAVYRIVQESLTNATRHAAGTPVTIRIEVGSGDTTVTVTSAGAPDPEPREGSGVLGMRERAEALGGRLLAGAWQGGWRVEAVLPT